MRFLTNTFSPLMLKVGTRAEVRECTLAEIPADIESAVGHEVTAKVISALLGQEVKFKRVNIALSAGDEVFCIAPNFRAEVAREFTKEEVEAAKFRCFHIAVC